MDHVSAVSFGALGFFVSGRHSINTALDVRYGGAHFRCTDSLPAVGPALSSPQKSCASPHPCEEPKQQ